MKAEVARVTATGGRMATTRHIPPDLALAVGAPKSPPPRGWRWVPLVELARLESGHTPSRKHPEYWGGHIPWIGIKDAKSHHGGRIYNTLEKTNDLGISNSSARLLPEHTVCLSRTASVGYVVVMGRPMATSQDFVNWICSEHLDPNFLKYLFIAEGKNLLRFASGAVHQTIYFPEVKAFHICCPPLSEQRRIVAILDEAFDGIAIAKANAERNRRSARALIDSYLKTSFARQRRGWSKSTIGESCTLASGGTPSRSNERFWKGAIPWVSAKDLKSERIQDSLLHISAEAVEKSATKIAPVGALLTLVRGMGLANGIPLAEVTAPVAFNQDIRAIHPPKTVIPRFLLLSLKSSLLGDAGEKILSSAAHGTLKIDTDGLRQLEFYFPALSEQRAIVSRFDSLQDETQRLGALNKRRVDACDSLKQSLLNQAFTGRL